MGDEEEENKNFEIKIMKGQDYFPKEEDEISGVLLDVPCTATGTCSHNPDILQHLLDIQHTLLLHTIDNILNNKNGGIIVYSTCSLLKEESEEQIKKILKLKSNNV